MEILKSGDVPALVTNIELLNILSKRIDKRNAQQDEGIGKKKSSRKLRHRDFIEEKVLDYLQYTPAANVEFEKMPELISRLNGENPVQSIEQDKEPVQDEAHDASKANSQEEKGYNLTDAETLQLLNHMPTEEVEIHLMIEDLMERMDENRQRQLLQLISEYAGEPVQGEFEEEEGEEETAKVV